MRDLRRHNRDDARNVFELGTVIGANAAPCDNLVRFELGFVNVRFDALVRRDSHQMIAERAAGFFRGDDMLEFYALESWVLGPGDILESDCFAREPELALVEFFKNIVTENSFFHDFTPIWVFCSRLFANCVAVMPEIYMQGCVEKLDKIAEMGKICKRTKNLLCLNF